MTRSRNGVRVFFVGACFVAASSTVFGNDSLLRNVSPDAGSSNAPLLFTINVHIEPHGAGRRTFGSSQAMNDSGKRQVGDYHNADFFHEHVENIKILAHIAETHGGKIVVQTQTPFTTMCIEQHENLLSDLEKSGHEIGLHFHEAEQLGGDPEDLSLNVWGEALHRQVDMIHQAGVHKVQVRSGGNLYSFILDASADAGLWIMGDYKNPRNQSSDARLETVNPWRPMGGPIGDILDNFAQHNPNGKVVYLPDGVFPNAELSMKNTIRAKNGMNAYFDYFTDALERSLRAARPDRVNVFHITVHPEEFLVQHRKQNFDVLNTWLTQVIDPLVKAGKVRWATFSEMANAYVAWEKQHPGVDPRANATTTNSIE